MRMPTLASCHDRQPANHLTGPVRRPARPGIAGTAAELALTGGDAVSPRANRAQGDDSVVLVPVSDVDPA